MSISALRASTSGRRRTPQVVHLQRNRYSVPSEHAHEVAHSLGACNDPQRMRDVAGIAGFKRVSHERGRPSSIPLG